MRAKPTLVRFPVYRILEGRIAGKRCIFLATAGNTATQSEIAKHVALVRPTVDAIVIFAAPWLSAHNRLRLIERGNPFVVPGKPVPRGTADRGGLGLKSK